ncbi:galactoside O-acetyltransferase [Photobacterium kishitanii]|uniref:Acetyltransferase n=1 Tax=Photobacterium kishitanii TaxID=318456 RepID=A0AAX0YQC8_9GAMM|nr:sugar O-acetyltransferase [Photobacterium kishitanii]KJG55521.1 galactoside O-acetyltransferase [Photobacterium kishitanii]KJG58203.1 galactoside O-acetyltransferase [Photobacterium kishitanii]KJG63768.1 galactoside O-acetyltransferase [Photobacterium kishitanii]KJG66817.1 galactoside O-acetyltransferase [Photobacterium kishitanii]PSX20676.1 sugar O-acetyltransferase [Photobacterium kishitanii]
MKVSPEDKLHSQKVYVCDEALAAQQLACLEVLYDFNHTRPSEISKRAELMQQLFAEVGKGCYIEPPLHANWGKHTHFGCDVYVNFNLTLVDDTHIYIGNNVMIGPNVTIATAGHPIDPLLRQQVTQFNIPVTIGNNVWIGANSVILPGVSIGDNTVIGAGSIVTKNIPSNMVAMGNPCKVTREISDHDKVYFYKNRKY